MTGTPSAPRHGPEDGSDPDDAGDALERAGPWAALGLVALGFVLRMRGVSEYWLNPDEGIYFSTLTRSSLGAFWGEVSANAHPPLFYLLLRGAGALTWDFVWLRGISVVFGTAAIGAVWLVGRELGGRGRSGVVAGLVPAALLAVNGEAITLSQVMRPYMMLLALLALALHQVLRFRSDPSNRGLALYSVCMVAALLVHYSAALALASVAVVVGYYALTRTVGRRELRRLAVAQVLPWLVFGALWARHVSATIDSPLMGDALGPDGWLGPWLIASPGDAWFSFATFQVFHLPPDFRGRAALLLIAALGVALARDRLVAVVVGSGLAAALSASVLGLYPFGGTRHNVWLLAFTLPALGWLAGSLIGRGPRASRIGAGVLAVALVAGPPLEPLLGPDFAHTNETDEQVIRREAIAPLIVGVLDPRNGPTTVVMTEQPYNLLMPLYAGQREDVRMSPDSTRFRFSYGARRVHVRRTWDWDGVDDLRRTLESLPGPGDPVLVVAGGWGSELFADMAELHGRGAVLQEVPVFGEGPAGGRLVRMVGLIVDPTALGGPS